MKISPATSPEKRQISILGDTIRSSTVTVNRKEWSPSTPALMGLRMSIGLLVLGSTIFAQSPDVAPLNPEFVKYAGSMNAQQVRINQQEVQVNGQQIAVVS